MEEVLISSIPMLKFQGVFITVTVLGCSKRLCSDQDEASIAKPRIIVIKAWKDLQNNFFFLVSRDLNIWPIVLCCTTKMQKP